MSGPRTRDVPRYGQDNLDLTKNTWTAVAWRPLSESSWIWRLTEREAQALRAAREAGHILTAQRRDWLADRMELLARWSNSQ